MDWDSICVRLAGKEGARGLMEMIYAHSGSSKLIYTPGMQA